MLGVVTITSTTYHHTTLHNTTPRIIPYIDTAIIRYRQTVTNDQDLYEQFNPLIKILLYYVWLLHMVDASVTMFVADRLMVKVMLVVTAATDRKRVESLL